ALRVRLPASTRHHAPLLISTPTPPPDPSTLPLHDALPICHHRIDRDFLDANRGKRRRHQAQHLLRVARRAIEHAQYALFGRRDRSEEHTSELQSRGHLVCRLLLEKKNRYMTELYEHTATTC